MSDEELKAVIFQSTLPAWGATRAFRLADNKTNISIHAPRMGSDVLFETEIMRALNISIHAPRMGSDLIFCFFVRYLIISIHAPRMGSDRVIMMIFYI